LISTVHVRLETRADHAAIRAVNEAAFESPAEADIVDVLRAKGAELVSLVAEREGVVLGHILFSPVSLAGHGELKLMGLGPMAVLPGHQGQGIGSVLVGEGLIRCKQLGAQAVVVVGHPRYYPRFGFAAAGRYGLRCEYDVPDDVFMVAELTRGVLQGVGGLIRYDEAFRGEAR
jgi:putative acetyltransferase